MVIVSPPDALPPMVMVMEEVTDPVELARAKAQHERFDRNLKWLQAHAPEAYSKNRGKYICVAGQELFVGETVEEAVAKARTAHPHDDGFYLQYVFPEKRVWIYANRW